MRNVDFMILTRENVEEYFKKIEATGEPVVIFGLTAQDYEYLSLNFADVLELLDQQNSVIVAYKKYYEQTDELIEKNNSQGEVEIEVESENNDSILRNIFK